MNRKQLVPLLIIVAVLLGAGAMGVVAFARSKGLSHQIAVASSSPEQSPTAASSPSSTPESPSPATPTPTPVASPSPSPVKPAASPPPAAPPVAPPPQGSALATRGIYRFTSTDFATFHAAGFNASTDGGVQDHGAVEAAAGIRGMVWVNSYSNTACTQTMNDASISALVQANVSAGQRGLRYEIGDEPTANGCNAAPAYAHMTAVVHAVDPSAKTWTADDQFQTGNRLQAGVPMKGTVDILAFDVYPCESGPCDFAAIDSAVRQIHAAGVTNWEFIMQDFNSSPWRWPTPAEIQAQFDHWKNQGAIGYWVFAWDYQGQQLVSQPGNLDALRAINS
jgi:hypothetical protein